MNVSKIKCKKFHCSKYHERLNFVVSWNYLYFKDVKVNAKSVNLPH